MTEIEERAEALLMEIAHNFFTDKPAARRERITAALRTERERALEAAAEKLTKMSELAAYNQESRTTEAAYALGARAIRALKSSDPAKE